MTGDLAGLGVLVTRPATQAGPLSRLIGERGGVPVGLPLQSIAACPPCAGHVPDEHAPLAIFTSVNAVRHAPAWGLHAGRVDETLAAGAATAGALQAAGFAVQAPEGADGSEALLALARLQAQRAGPVLIVTGQRARPLLADALRERGFAVQVLEVYRRVAVAHTPRVVSDALTRVEAAILANGEALGRLCEVTPPESAARLMRLQLVVASDRVAEEARRLGFARAALAPRQVGDQALVDCLGAWRRNSVASSS